MVLLNRIKKSLAIAVLGIIYFGFINAGMAQSEWINISGHEDPLNSNKGSNIKSPIIIVKGEFPCSLYEINLFLPGFLLDEHKVKGVKYKSLQIPGWETQSEIGKPGVPMKIIMLRIPPKTTPIVTVSSIQEIVMNNINALPKQSPQPETSANRDMSSFKRDMIVYNESRLFPSSNIIKKYIIWKRNQRILVLEITPIRVNPKIQTANIASSLNISVTLELKKGDDILNKPGVVGSEYNYDGSSIDNGRALKKYMIIIDDQFFENSKLHDFIEWKKMKGNDVRVVKTSEISASIPGSPAAEEIVTFMRLIPDNMYPEFLLIIGNENQEHGVAGTYYVGGYTDHDFACRNSNDFIPDLHYGRLPASNNDELTIMIDKVLMMDRNPPESDMYDRVVVAGQIQDNDEDNIADYYFAETLDYIANYFERDDGEVYYDCTRAVVNPDSVTSDCKWSPYSIVWKGSTGADRIIGNRVYNTFVSEDEAKIRIVNNINNGISLLQHRDHGTSRGWIHPNFKTNDVNLLYNGKNLPLVLSINCSTGAYFKSQSFINGLMKHSNGGAYAFVGAVKVSYTKYNDYLSHGFYMGFLDDYRKWHDNLTNPHWTGSLPKPSPYYDSFFEEGGATKLGYMVDFAKYYVFQRFGSSYICKDTIKNFHLFGDPEADICFHKPVDQDVTYPEIIDINSENVTITAKSDGSVVCLYSKDLDIHKAQTTSNGEATFNVNPGGSGVIHVTVTKFGCRPFLGTIQVESQESLVAHWMLDGNGEDSSINGNAGEVYGGEWVDGVVDDGALKFDGSDDYVDFGNDKSLAIDNVITIAAWVNNKNSETRAVAICKGDYRDDGWYWWIDNKSWRISINSKDSYARVSSHYRIPVDEWHHLVSILDNNNRIIYFYADGKLIATEEMPFAFSLNEERSLYLGRYSDNGKYYWKGLMDDVRIYNRALNEMEILEMSNNIEFQ